MCPRNTSRQQLPRLCSAITDTVPQETLGQVQEHVGSPATYLFDFCQHLAQ
jgi:hypothetical protein